MHESSDGTYLPDTQQLINTKTAVQEPGRQETEAE